MKKKRLLIISILFLAISIVLLILSLINYEFRFSYELCMDLFGCEPQEFLDYEFEYDELNDLRKGARINRHGELVLSFPKQRRKALLESEWLKLVYDDYSEYSIYVNSDLKMITAYNLDAKGDEYFDEQIRILNNILTKIHFINFLNRDTTQSVTIVEMSMDGQEELSRFDIPYGGKVTKITE